MADISWFYPVGYAVAQSTRPSIFSHYLVGQNTGSQGKGPTLEQATVAAMMEAVEGFCYEPRNAPLLRGSYEQLRRGYVLLDPNAYTRTFARAGIPIGQDEQLMWTWAVSLEHEVEVLVPAETVFFPFCAKDYSTQPYFPSGSNGGAAGATLVEATLHGLYEVIERHCEGSCELGEAEAEAIIDSELDTEQVRLLRETMPECELVIYAVSFPRKRRSIPMVFCYLLRDGGSSFGACAQLDAKVAISKAISEAIQSMATQASGAREDMWRKTGKEKKPLAMRRIQEAHWARLPRRRTMHVDDFLSRSIPYDRSSIKGELDGLMEWVHEAGHPHVLVSNLTRSGVDVPCVKVIVPGARVRNRAANIAGWTTKAFIERQYCIDFA